MKKTVIWVVFILAALGYMLYKWMGANGWTFF
jgi:hypothetical protein